MKKYVFLFLILFVTAAGALMLYSKNHVSNTDSAPSQKSESLEEYLKNSTENWFLTGKKKYTIQAMMVSKEMTFHNDLEVVDLVASDDGETVVLIRNKRRDMDFSSAAGCFKIHEAGRQRTSLRRF